MTAYAIAHLRSVDQNAEIVDYLRRIDATLDPFDGRFAVHGVVPEVLEGEWPGVIVVIGFPDPDAARAWYDSPVYQEILPLRTRNSDGVTLIVDGVPDGYRAVDYLAKLGQPELIVRHRSEPNSPAYRPDDQCAGRSRSSARASGTPGR